MKVAIDCDGVLYEFDKTARYMLREYRGCTGLESNPGSWLLPNQDWHNVTKADWSWLWSEGVKMGLFRYGHVIKGAIVGIRELSEARHTLILVTHRPAVAVQDTVDWLSYVRLPFDEIRIISDGSPKTTVEADVLVDDKPENLLDWVKAGRHAIKFEQPWNKYVALAGLDPERGKLLVAKDWKEVTQWVRKLSA